MQFVTFSVAILTMVSQVRADGHLCLGVNNTFTAKIDLHASAYGYYTFEECGDMVNPTLGLEIGETYTFVQNDRTNYMHPLGFAYYAGGAHVDKPELEPAVTADGTDGCIANATCPAPMYYVGGEYPGEYSNLDSEATVGAENFGLDDYEPVFFFPIREWIARGPYEIKLKFDIEDYGEDLFYFCHIHQFMAGRIKLLKNGVEVNAEDTPELGYEYEVPGPFDEECGTYDLDRFELPNAECPSQFVCDTETASPSVAAFAKCLDAMNCHMLAGMTTGVKADNQMVLFIHQMIPHHENAVNMAKALLRTGRIDCEDLTSEETVDCVMEAILREMVNVQNAQIHTMLGVLDGLGAAEKDDCILEVPQGIEVNRLRTIERPPARRLDGHDGLCLGINNTFTAKVDLFASEYGYYIFEECGDMVNPTLGLEVGETYTFIQNDRTNYMHPLGFAYFAGGAHVDKPELEPGVSSSASSGDCIFNATCPAPMYFVGGEYPGDYSNIESILSPTTTGAENFGLDDYEPLFFFPIGEWLSRGPYSIQLKFDDETYNEDLFYFCHIHQYMAGRVKLLQNGTMINSDDTPELGYEYDTPGTFDEECGTYDLDRFALPNDECPEKFVCNDASSSSLVSPAVRDFAECIDAMNCHMIAGMTTGVKADDELVLFLHQMIPHHQNAVNMAKALLKTGAVTCDDLTGDDESMGCVMEPLLREMVNGQNAQIHTMRGILKELGAPEKDDCVVKFLEDQPTADGTATPTSSPGEQSEAPNSDSPNTSGNARGYTCVSLIWTAMTMIVVAAVAGGISPVF